MINWRVINRGWKTEAGSESTSCLLRLDDGSNIVVNPSLSGNLMRQRLFDRSGLDISEIDYVISLDSEYFHHRDFEIFKRAQYLMPADALHEAKPINPILDGVFVEKYREFPAEGLTGLTLLRLSSENQVYGLSFSAGEGEVLIAPVPIEYFENEGSNIKTRYDIIVPEYGKMWVKPTEF